MTVSAARALTCAPRWGSTLGSRGYRHHIYHGVGAEPRELTLSAQRMSTIVKINICNCPHTLRVSELPSKQKSRCSRKRDCVTSSPSVRSRSSPPRRPNCEVPCVRLAHDGEVPCVPKARWVLLCHQGQAARWVLLCSWYPQ